MKLTEINIQMTRTPEILLERALQLALNAHRGQIDKAGKPYILHPLRLMLKLENNDQQIVAVLHDVVEDSNTTLNDLTESGFPKDIVYAIDCLTKRDGETYDCFIARIKKNDLARRVKIEDLKDNLNLSRLQAITQKDLDRADKYRKALAELESTDSTDRTS